MIKDIYPKILELFELNRDSVLATIINRSGSGPRAVGAKLLILEDGSSVGTIGGGSLELSVLEESKKVFASRFPARFNYLPENSKIKEHDMSCGSAVEVFLEPVSPDSLNHLYIFKEITDIIRRGGSALLATVVDAGQWNIGQIPKMLIKPTGERIGSLLGIREIEDAVAGRMGDILEGNDPANVICRDREGNSLNIFVEPVISDPVLFVFGGGHVSSHLVPLAHRVGFKVIVIDDRPEFSDPDKFPEADEVLNYPFDSVIEKLTVNKSSYIVIITRGHSHDKNVLAQSLKTPAMYIGMIGSKRKISIIYGKLLEEGFTGDQLDRIHSPIGIDIGAETPEEIAVSIIAELIKVRSGS